MFWRLLTFFLCLGSEPILFWDTLIYAFNLKSNYNERIRFTRKKQCKCTQSFLENMQSDFEVLRAKRVFIVVLRKSCSLSSTKRACNFLPQFVRKGNSNWIFKSLVLHFQWRVVYLRANEWFLHLKYESISFRHELYKISRASLSLPFKCLSALPNNRTPTVSFTASFLSISINDRCTAAVFSHRL